MIAVFVRNVILLRFTWLQACCYDGERRKTLEMLLVFRRGFLSSLLCVYSFKIYFKSVFKTLFPCDSEMYGVASFFSVSFHFIFTFYFIHFNLFYLNTDHLLQPAAVLLQVRAYITNHIQNIYNTK